jgi:hypothetical protein
MKKMIWIVLIVVFFINGVAWAQIGTSTARNLLVRSGPGKNYRVIAKIKRGDQRRKEYAFTKTGRLSIFSDGWTIFTMVDPRYQSQLDIHRPKTGEFNFPMGQDGSGPIWRRGRG